MTITKSVSIIAPPGIYAVHAAPAQMIVLDSIVRDNGGGGISIGGGASVVLDYVRVERNAGDGVTLAGTALGVSAEIRNSLFAHNGFSGVAAVIPGGSAKTGVVMEDSSISQNAADGVFAGGIGDGTLLVTLRRSSVAGNGAAGLSVFKNNTAALVQAISVDNTLLDNAVADTKADGQNVRADLSRNTFMLTGNNIWTLNGGGHITWQDNIGAASYIGGVPAPFTPF